MKSQIKKHFGRKQTVVNTLQQKIFTTSPTIGIITLNCETNNFTITNLSKSKLKLPFQTTRFQKLDIIIIGLQEDKPTSQSDVFFTQIFPNHQLLRNILLTGITKSMRMILFIHNKYQESPSITSYKICNHLSCPGGLMCCSKGLIAIKINDFLFVNSHLAYKGSNLSTGQGLDLRIKMMKDMIKTLRKNNLLNLPNHKQNQKIFWFGDLNFRISPIKYNLEDYNQLLSRMVLQKNNLTKNKNAQLLKNFSVKKFIEYDQLSRILDSKMIDINFIESPITFRPTCKISKTQSENQYPEYQIIKDSTPRIPSWCDRIIYTPNITSIYKKIKYQAFNPLSFVKTDHFGVYSIFD